MPVAFCALRKPRCVACSVWLRSTVCNLETVNPRRALRTPRAQSWSRPVSEAAARRAELSPPLRALRRKGDCHPHYAPAPTALPAAGTRGAPSHELTRGGGSEPATSHTPRGAQGLADTTAGAVTPTEGAAAVLSPWPRRGAMAAPLLCRELRSPRPRAHSCRWLRTDRSREMQPQDSHGTGDATCIHEIVDKG